MTREEQLEWLCRLRSKIYVYMPKEWLIPMNDALDISIKDLEQEPKSEWEHDHEILRAYANGANEILGKIRAEINTMCGDIETIADVLAIFDKYKAESEGNE